MHCRLMTSLMAAMLLVAPLAASGACMVSSTVLSFGAIDPLIQMQHDSTAEILVTCDASTQYAISLSAGQGTFSQRTMVSASGTLNYNLYIDSQRTLIWGDGTGITRTVNGSADTSGTAHTVYASVPWQSRAIPGTYGDSIVITVIY